jgi:hypothetical protein
LHDFEVILHYFNHFLLTNLHINPVSTHLQHQDEFRTLRVLNPSPQNRHGALPRTFPSKHPFIVSTNTTQGFVWGGFVVATLFVIFRAWARWHTFKRYFLDDAFVLLALVMFFISAVLWQYSAKYMYQDLYIASGLSSTIPTNFISDSEKYLRAQIGIIFLFMSGLWSVKIAFLLFFRRLGENVSGQRVHWWGAFAFTIATYLVTIGTIEYNCLAPPFLTVVMTCSGESAKHFEHVTLATNLAFDISTDLLSMYSLCEKHA